PFLKWQRVTLTLLFCYIIHKKRIAVYNNKSQCKHLNKVFKSILSELNIRNQITNVDLSININDALLNDS
ncbi:hypothetical protein COE43_30760, partial [Bacillus cereus]